jgi:nucleotide-binding universal stress UspA family protein
MMYQHILLAVALQRDDGISGHALAARKVALSVAGGTGAKLTVLIVYDYDSLDLSLSLPAEDLSRYRDTQRAHIDEMMEQKMKTFLSIGEAVEVPITQVLKVGEPRTLINSTAEKLGVDLLVIGAHSKRGIVDARVGGTAAYLSRHAPCPVVTVQPREEGHLASQNT